MLVADGKVTARLSLACRDLAGKDLACWCPLPAAGEPGLCHAAALLVIANQHDLPG